MTTRKTQFTAQISKPNSEPEQNPLNAFFRKSKLSLKLPSRGKWYPESGVTLDASGGVSVFAMTATDDIKFRTGDATLTGRNIYDVIHSCIPSITEPDAIPHIDLDAILLAIRYASYGDTFDFTVGVPNTTLTRVISLSSHSLLQTLNLAHEDWDSSLTIEDETGFSLHLDIHPVPLHKLFSTSKNLFQQKRNLSRNIDSDQNIKDEDAFAATMSNLTSSALDLLCSSINSLSIVDNAGITLQTVTNDTPQDSAEMSEIIRNMDISYFNAIRNHIDSQRKKFLFTSPKQTSDAHELLAGAPETWHAELIFAGSNFLPSQKTGV